MGAAVAVAGGTLTACSSGSGGTAPAASQTDPAPSDPAPSDAAPSDASPSDASKTAAGEPTAAVGVAAKGTSAAGHRTTSGTTAKPPTSSSKPTSTPASSSRPTSKRVTTTTGPAGEDFAKGALAPLASVPVGGSLKVGEVIIGRPSSTHVVGHSAICTHQGCPVQAGGRTLHCPCHGSTFDAFSGAVGNGPAASPLPGVALVIKGSYVHPA